MKRSLKNTISFVSGEAGSRGAGFLITAYLGRVLEPSAFGVMNIGLSVMGYLLLIASPGIQTLETRNAAAQAQTNEPRVNAILSLRLFLSGILLICSSVIASITIGAGEIRESIIFFSLSLIPFSLFLDWFFQAKEEFAFVSIAKFLSYVVYGCFIVAGVHSAGDFALVPLGFAAGNAVGSAFLLIRFRKFGRVRLVWRPAEWKSLLSSNVPVGISVFLAQSAMNLPPIVIGLLVSTADAGMFSAALKIVFVALMLDRILNALFLPVVTRYFASWREEIPFLISTVTKFVIVVIVPFTVSGIILSPLVVRIVFGAGYAGAAPLLQILTGYFFLTLINSIFVCALLGGGRERAYIVAINAGSLMLVGGIVLGTFAYGTTGAAVGVVLGELCAVTLMWMQVRKMAGVPGAGVFVRPAVASCVMIGAALLLREQGMPAQVIISLSVFVVALLASGGIDREEIRFLRERFV